MRVPISMMVGGKRVRIEYLSDLPDGNAAELVCGERLIRVSKAKHKSERELFSSLYHELCHFAFEIAGHSVEWSDAQEEPLVYCLENMLAELFVFHPNAPIKYREINWPGEDD